MKTSILIYILVFFSSLGYAQHEKLYYNPEKLIEQLYKQVTFEAKSLPNWDQVRRLFHPNATIVLRTSKEHSTVFDLEGFIKDFDDFAKKEKVQQNGFEEKILNKKETTFGDISHFLVLYEAHFPNMDYPPQQGVDSFHLIKTETGWKIMSIVNEIVTPERPAPKDLQ
jgi:hypothetical protein